MADVEELFADPPFIGRRDDLARLVGLLDQRPAVAAVRGGHGSGRSTMLFALRRIADARGWRTVRTNPSTRHRTRGSGTRAAEAGGANGDRSQQRHRHAGCARQGARVQAMGPEPPAADGLGSDVRAAEVRTITDGLASQPTLLLLDDYRPDRDVERWLLDKVLGPLQTRQRTGARCLRRTDR